GSYKGMQSTARSSTQGGSPHAPEERSKKGAKMMNTVRISALDTKRKLRGLGGPTPGLDLDRQLPKTRHEEVHGPELELSVTEGSRLEHSAGRAVALAG